MLSLSQQDRRAFELYKQASGPRRMWKQWDEISWRTKTMYRIVATRELLISLAPHRHP